MAAVKAEGKCVNVGNCLRWISKNVNGGVYFFFWSKIVLHSILAVDLAK